MALIEGTTFSGKFSELTIINYTKPDDDQGAVLGAYQADTVSKASSESQTTKIGAAITIYAPALAAVLGSEDF